MAYNKKGASQGQYRGNPADVPFGEGTTHRHTGGSGHTRRLLRVRGIKAVLSPFGKLTDILRWTQADRELFPWLRNFTTSCMTEPLTNVNTNGWWKA